jgi:hypothetical protein
MADALKAAFANLLQKRVDASILSPMVGAGAEGWKGEGQQSDAGSSSWGMAACPLAARSQRAQCFGFSAVTGGRAALPGGTLPSHQTKTVALDAQQVQQLLISTMKDRPVHLGLCAFALLLQLCPSHLLVSAIGARLSPTKASAVHTRALARIRLVAILHHGAS